MPREYRDKEKMRDKAAEARRSDETFAEWLRTAFGVTTNDEAQQRILTIAQGTVTILLEAKPGQPPFVRWTSIPMDALDMVQLLQAAAIHLTAIQNTASKQADEEAKKKAQEDTIPEKSLTETPLAA